ncbi:Fc receptor-like protein 5 isoform X5 [Puntigrus tetrazona]|uniref:Fc receptor-like protein 5 isoform X5 n=1 Tax=Puntigrus tetrazona TaxID=1606681 RepID=UPI001C89A01E|nr:Fc receptor-like protein 5 isoform X5 [Puntigrus tetrazona]
MELGQLLILYLISNIISGQERPKAIVTIKPDQHVFREETVTLRCDIDAEGVTSWTYSWYKDGSISVFNDQEHTFWFVRMSDAGKYSCYGRETEGTQTSNVSDNITLTVSDNPKAVLSVSPQNWLNEGDPVTLICKVNGFSSGWTFSWYITDWAFSWYTDFYSTANRYGYKLLSDSSRGAGGNYTVSSAVLKHTGVYVCRAKRGKPAYSTDYSNKQLIWVSDYYSPITNLIISPNRTQHFTSVSLSLSCNSDRRRVRRYTDGRGLEYCASSYSESQEFTCTINSTNTLDTGVYWCHFKYGENMYPVNITVHSHVPSVSVAGVILESPVHPVNEGDTLTLHCLYEHSTPTRADFFKDGSLIQSQTTEMIISNVSKSHEGFYYCKHPERGESPKSWISVRDYGYIYKLLSDSSRGAGGNYTVNSAALKHTGVYVCRATRGKPAYSTDYSNKQLIWVSDHSSPITNLIISPNGTQHLTSVSLSLSCEDQSNSKKWKVSRYTDILGLEDCESSYSESQEFTCTINSTNTLDTGVYWCHFKDGENMYPVNITVHSHVPSVSGAGVILESPFHPVTEGDSLTLHCLYQPSTPPNFRADFYKDGSLIQSQTTEMIISNVSKSHEGFYYCKHPEKGESPKSWISVRETPKPKVSIKPDQHVFRGETVTLRCDIDGGEVTIWQYSWYKDGSDGVFSELQEHTFSSVTESDAGKYFCYGAERGGSRRSQQSDAVTLRVVVLRAVLSVSPQKWLSEGDPVTLICEVNSSSTGWTFSWYTQTTSSDINDYYKLLSDSSRGAGGNYTVSSAALKHTGVYVCRAERGKPAYNTTFSNTQPLWVTSVSPPVSLIISPNRTQHFTSVSLSLSCEDQSNSDRWRVKRYTDNEQLEDCSSSVWGLQKGSICTIISSSTSDTGVYWCQSESGENYQPINITVHTGVILESPVHPLTEGDSLTLRCLYPYISQPDLRADFYKEGSLIQSQTTEMIISNVSKSHEGFYYCKHPERGESPKSWISVRAGVILESPVHPVTEGDSLTLRCLYQPSTPPNLRADFYKDGSLIQSQTTEMIISNVSKSHEGFYYCKHPERGESPKSWISVRAFDITNPMGSEVIAGLTVTFLFIVLLVLLWHYRNNKGGWSPSSVSQQKNSSQKSELNQSGGTYKTLQSESVNVPTELTYAEFELKSMKNQKKSKRYKGKTDESSDIIFRL